MHSLIPEFNPFRLLCRLVFLFLVITPFRAMAGSPAQATDLSVDSFLETPRIVAVGNEGEIHITFSTDVRYIRHFPEGRGDTLRIFIEVIDPCLADHIQAQESKWLPPADWFVPFTVSFPEIIKRTGSVTTVCPSTGKRVDVAETVLVKFRKVLNYKVKRGNDNRSIIVMVPLLGQPQTAQAKVQPAAENVTPKQEIPPKAPTAVEPVVQAEAAIKVQEPQEVVSAGVTQEPKMSPADLMVAGRAALGAGDALTATQLLNQLLNLPPNAQSQEAQELIGMAREKAGEAAKARAEYQLYLKLYPDGDGAARVRQRLAALEAVKEPPKKAEQEAKTKKAFKQVSQDTITGSVSQYYYGGRSSSYSKTASDPTTRTVGVDQSSLITNVDVSGRFRHNQYDTKVVFRDTETENALPDRAARNTVSAAYLEHENKDIGYMFRAGRQSGTAQGVLGRFDGVFGKYYLNDKWKLTAVIGQPDDGTHNKVTTNRHFYGAGVEFGPIAEKWSGTVYGIQQIADGFEERRAVGTEVRYFDGTTSWFGMTEYDALYNAFNLAMLQGNWVAFDGYNFNFLVDHRKSPILYADTALQAGNSVSTLGGPGLFATRIRDLLHNPRFSDNDIYNFVKDLTAESDMVMLGVTKQVTPRWQLGGDARVNQTSSTEGIFIPADATYDAVDIPVQKRSGYIYSYTLQAIGNSVLIKDDSTSLMANFINDPTYNAQNYSVSNSFTFRERWRTDTSLSYYHELRNTDVKTWKITPSIRLNYRLKDNVSFEAQYTFDRTRTYEPDTNTKSGSTRQSLFMGYRWDYR